MLYPPQGLQLPLAEVGHQIVERKALIGLDVPERRRLPIEVEHADRVGFYCGR
jgi:hypothetical protein